MKFRKQKVEASCSVLVKPTELVVEHVSNTSVRFWLIQDEKLSLFLSSDLFSLLRPFFVDESARGVRCAVARASLSKIAEIMAPKYVLRSIPMFVTRMLEFKALKVEHSKDLLSEAYGAGRLFNALKDFQIKGVDFAISRDGRCLIADEMGLGKTLQALAIAAHYRADWPTLVVAPSALKHQWEAQVVAWLGNLFSDPKIELQVLLSKKNKIRSTAKFVIVSYELVRDLEWPGEECNVLIVDESHYVKDARTKRAACLLPLAKRVRRVVLLSGTPALNYPAELFLQLEMIQPGWSNYHEFTSRYSNEYINRFTQRRDYRGERLSMELNCVFSMSFMIRRLKKDVFQELPPKLRSCVPLELPALEKSAIQSKVDALSAVPGDSRHRLVMELFRLTGAAKIVALKEYLRLVMEQSKHLLVFAHHLSVIDELEAFVKSAKVKLIRIDGSVPLCKRVAEMEKFQRGDAQVALLSITACGTGLEFTAADTVVFAELYWVPGQLIQAEDRAHRIGMQAKCVNVHYCVARGTLDEIVWSNLNRKWSSLTASLNGAREAFDASCAAIE